MALNGQAVNHGKIHSQLLLGMIGEKTKTILKLLVSSSNGLVDSFPSHQFRFSPRLGRKIRHLRKFPEVLNTNNAFFITSLGLKLKM